MSKSNVKQLHALIDELADAGKSEMLTALHLILSEVAQADAADGELNLSDVVDDDDDDKKSSGRRGKRGGKKTAADDDDDDLSGLADLEVDDDDDEKPARGKKRRGKMAEAEDDDDDQTDAGGETDLPAMDEFKTFEKFLDAVDAVEEWEQPEGGLRELSKEMIEVYDIDPADLDLGLSKKLDGRELRKAKTLAIGNMLAKFDFIRDELVNAGAEAITDAAEEMDIDISEATGRGKDKLAAQAVIIVNDVYGSDDTE